MTTKSDRDRSIEALLRQPLAEQGRSGASDAHLDAETLAAWADGGLSDDDLAVAEAHAADCSSCQATVAALTRTAGLSPAPQAWWRRAWNLGWLVPLAAATAAVAIWVAVPNRQRPASSLQPAFRPPAASEVTEYDKSTASDKRADGAAAPVAVVGGVHSSPPAAAPNEARREQANAEPPGARDVRQKGAITEEKSVLADQLSVADSVGRVATPPALAAAPPPAAAVVAPAPERQRFAKEAVAGLVAARVVGLQEIVSSDPSIRWRLGRAGLIQRSADGGSTWEVLPTRVAADLLAGMSSSPSICWVVGRAGTVLRSLDGRRFEPVPFPESVDLASVRVTDAQTVVVTTIDGRAFRTADGGTTWTQNR